MAEVLGLREHLEQPRGVRVGQRAHAARPRHERLAAMEQRGERHVEDGDLHDPPHGAAEHPRNVQPELAPDSKSSLKIKVQPPPLVVMSQVVAVVGLLHSDPQSITSLHLLQGHVLKVHFIIACGFGK